MLELYREFILTFQSGIFPEVLTVIRVSAPVWVPIVFGSVFMNLWLRYVRSDFLAKQGYVLLEVKIPKNIMRSLRAMEVFFAKIWEKGSVTYFDTYRDGKVRPWYSFEIASFGGDIRFYIWTFSKFKNVVEAQIYAQYPTVEITEVRDYALPVRFDPAERFMWGTYFGLSKPDPYPIMTYVDYGLDREEEEEFKVDPMTPVLEFLGSIKKGEQLWIQILIQAHAPLGLINGHLFPRPDWQEAARKEINGIMLRHPQTKSARKLSPSGFPVIPTLTEGEKKQVEAIERSIGKSAYECAIRVFYIAENELSDQIPLTVAGLVGVMRQYSSNDLNGFRLGWYTDLADRTKDFFNLFFVPKKYWQRFQQKYARRFLDAYKRRSFFYHPYRFFKQTPIVLTAEELATIYHFPGQVSTTPTFERILAKKVEPPPNLPV